MIESMNYFSIQPVSHDWCNKEGSVLFNDALNAFIFGYMASDIIMVKDHSDSEKGNPLPQHGLLFPISSKSSFICIIPQIG